MKKAQVEPGRTVLYRIEVNISATLSADSAVSWKRPNDSYSRQSLASVVLASGATEAAA